MRATSVIAGTMVLLSVVAGCSQAGDQGAPANAPATTASSPADSTGASPTLPVPSSKPPAEVAPPGTGSPPPDGVTPVPKEQVDTGALPPYYDRRDVLVSADGRAVTVYGMARDACAGVTAKVTEQSADIVRIVIVPLLAPQGGPPDQICAQVLTARSATVLLDAPLGSRKVIVSEES